MSKLLESVQMVAPLLNVALPYECMVAITDTEKYIGYYPSSKLQLPIEVGASLRENGVNHNVVTKGERIISHVPATVYGIPYIAVGLPLVEDGQVVGCLSTAITTDREEKIQQIANSLSSVADDILRNTKRLEENSMKLESASQDINTSTTIVRTKIEEASAFSDQINQISRRSNILGLNASIEASRAGVHGRGFSIVAEEVRKLSQSTNESASNISSQLEEINQLINKVSIEMETSKNSTVEQAAGIQELSAVIHKLHEMIIELESLANSITKDQKEEEEQVTLVR